MKMAVAVKISKFYCVTDVATKYILRYDYVAMILWFSPM